MTIGQQLAADEFHTDRAYADWQAGIAGTILSVLSPRAQEIMRTTANPFEVPTRAILAAERANASGHLILVQSGLLRVYSGSPSGREVTVRLARPGEIVGLPTVLTGHSQASVQAVAPSRGLSLSAPALRAIAQDDARVAWAIAQSTANLLFTIQERLTHDVFAPIRSRVARHLLDIATPANGVLVAVTSNEEIADGIGTVREVVARSLTRLRNEGLVRRMDGSIVLVDVRGLRSAAQNNELVSLHGF